MESKKFVISAGWIWALPVKSVGPVSQPVGPPGPNQALGAVAKSVGPLDSPVGPPGPFQPVGPPGPIPPVGPLATPVGPPEVKQISDLPGFATLQPRL